MAWLVHTWKIQRIFQSQFLSGRSVPKHATNHIQTRCVQEKKGKILCIHNVLLFQN